MDQIKSKLWIPDALLPKSGTVQVRPECMSKWMEEIFKAQAPLNACSIGGHGFSEFKPKTEGGGE